MGFGQLWEIDIYRRYPRAYLYNGRQQQVLTVLSATKVCPRLGNLLWIWFGILYYIARLPEDLSVLYFMDIWERCRDELI